MEFGVAEFLTVWLVCAALAHGWGFAVWQGRFPESAAQNYWGDLFFNALISLAFGPTGLLLAVVEKDCLWYRWRPW